MTTTTRPVSKALLWAALAFLVSAPLLWAALSFVAVGPNVQKQTRDRKSRATEPGNRKGRPLIFDVRDYGAKGDFVHDDTAALQAAFDAAGAAGGGTVYLPAGTYRIYPKKRQLYSLANTTVCGDGPKSVLKVADDAGDYLFIFRGPLNGVLWTDFAIDQNPAGNTRCDVQEATSQNIVDAEVTGTFRACRLTVTCCGYNAFQLIGKNAVGVVIDQCAFTFVRANTTGSRGYVYDHSTLSLDGGYHLVAGNTFSASAGDVPNTAIELHGGPCHRAVGNAVSNYNTAVLITDTQPGLPHQDCKSLVLNNVASGAYTGINLWAHKGQTLKDVSVLGNRIGGRTSGGKTWKNPYTGKALNNFDPGGYRGVLFYAGAGSGGEFVDFDVRNNTWDFRGVPAGSRIADIEYQKAAAGVVSRNNVLRK